MTNLREAAQMALDAATEELPKVDERETVFCSIQGHHLRALCEFVRAALAQPEQEELGEIVPADEEQLKRIAKLVELEPVAWMHNFIDEVVIAHRPVDLDRHPDRWTALYKDPTPCQTCEALARTVMMDQVSYDTPPQHRKPPTQDLNAPLTVNGVPMYPQREWQGLTEAERIDILDAELTTQNTEHFALAQAIEQALKEKNT